MHVFGQFPTHDEFSLVVCNVCDQVFKPQGILTHYGKSVVPLRCASQLDFHWGRERDDSPPAECVGSPATEWRNLCHCFGVVFFAIVCFVNCSILFPSPMLTIMSHQLFCRWMFHCHNFSISSLVLSCLVVTDPLNSTLQKRNSQQLLTGVSFYFLSHWRGMSFFLYFQWFFRVQNFTSTLSIISLKRHRTNKKLQSLDILLTRRVFL